ncbi:MAG: HlyD family efflux transporter periplasmic adaptor subunit [Proteobacteria bacterium]|nr:HlyD family efflux transporter periplasmic adaptor subunit [Pseudomonadota bacterium]
MRIRDIVILTLAILIGSGWVIFSGKDGFKATNGMIVARSISIVSTIEGRVEITSSEVGAKVAKNALLASIRNHRIDLTRSAELQSRLTLLQSEILNARQVHDGLTELHKKFEKRRTSLLAWRLEDLRLQQSVLTHAVNAAIERNRLKSKEVGRTQMLFQKAHVSNVNLDTVKAEAAIAQTKLESAKAKLARAELLMRTATANDTIIFEDGETSYWDKTIDILNLRLFDNAAKLMTLRAQLDEVQAQLDVENERMRTNFVEEHRAPFDGIVNAVFVTRGARVNSGTPLFQVLDCSRPIAIVPIPEHRFSEFSVGQKVTVYPIDSEQAIQGTIKLLSSGPLLGRDTTISVQQDMTLTGARAIVGFDGQNQSRALGSCDSARKAVVTIHTKSLFDTMAAWFYENFPKTVFNGNDNQSIPAS